jgi:hypothetical protein
MEHASAGMRGDSVNGLYPLRDLRVPVDSIRWPIVFPTGFPLRTRIGNFGRCFRWCCLGAGRLRSLERVAPHNAARRQLCSAGALLLGRASLALGTAFLSSTRFRLRERDIATGPPNDLNGLRLVN